MIGWLRGLKSFTAIARLRAPPEGWISVFMILTGLLGIVADLSTNLISSAAYGSRWGFKVGIVVSDDDSRFYL